MSRLNTIREWLRRSFTYDFQSDAARAKAVELDKKDGLAGAEIEPRFREWDNGLLGQE